MNDNPETAENKWFGINRADIDWYPVIDTGKCLSCLICVRFCKKGVYAEKSGKPAVVKPKNCVVGCRGCDGKCPVGAISHPSDAYLEELIKSKTEDTISDCCSSCGV